MSLLKKFLDWLWKLHYPVVLRNQKLKGLYTGETCLIFGNGGSLKYCDFSALPNLPAICTAYSLVDKRMDTINVKYWVIPDSYVLFPFLLKNGRFVKNHLLPLLKKIAIKHPKINLITSLTHFYCPFPKMNSVTYFHHFGNKGDGGYDLAKYFSVCDGSLDIMLGVAKYLGFSKVVLLGCDYLGSPKLEGHFYSDAIPVCGIDEPKEYTSRIRKVAGQLDVTVILPTGYSCKYFDVASFKDYFGALEFYQSNEEIVGSEYLLLMRKAKQQNQIYM